jgi:hypothetical protein
MTSRTILRRSAAVAIALCVSSSSAQAQTQIFPPTGPGGGYVIAVVSDAYMANEEWMFNRAVNGLVLNGLLADKFFKDNGAAFTVQKFFRPVAKSGESAFGIKPNYNIHQCYIDFDPSTTTTLIDNVVKLAAPERVIVIGNYEGVAMGCTVDTWSYLSSGAREVVGVLEHEFGHLIGGLLDEYSLPPDKPYRGEDIDELNCSNAPFKPPPVGGRGGPPPPPPEPWWKKLSLPSTPTEPQGCNYAATRIVRPYEHCRMHAAHADFCPVCVHELTGALEAFKAKRLSRADAPRPMPILLAGFAPVQSAKAVQPAAQPPAQPERPPAGGRTNIPDRQPVPGTPVVPTVRVVLELTPIQGGVSTKVLTIADVTTPRIQRYRRTGDLVYAVVENNTVLESGVIAGDPFQRRVYGGSGAPHQTGTATKASVVVMIPNVDRQQLQARTIGIRFYRLKPTTGRAADGTRDDITPERLNAMVGNREAAPFAELSSVDLKKAAQQLP